MNLIRHTQTDPFLTLFGDLFAAPPTLSRRATSNRDVRVKNFDTYTQISVAAPGLSNEDFQVDLRRDTLTITYQGTDTDTAFFSQKSFDRSWRLTEGVTPDDVTATYKNGVLDVTVQFPETESTTTTIPVV